MENIEDEQNSDEERSNSSGIASALPLRGVHEVCRSCLVLSMEVLNHLAIVETYRREIGYLKERVSWTRGRAYCLASSR